MGRQRLPSLPRIDPMQIRNHTTGHGDLRWTHLTKTSVVIFD
ncbi:hypothetical protein ACFW9V_02360 [Streptomyces hygroscopicus]